jgi:hypothetical protein
LQPGYADGPPLSLEGEKPALNKTPGSAGGLFFVLGFVFQGTDAGVQIIRKHPDLSVGLKHDK